MRWKSVYSCACVVTLAALAASPAQAASTYVGPGGNLQAALNAAQPGDTVLLDPSATFVGNFVLPVHAGTTYITVRSATSDDLLPSGGTRIVPAYAPYLAKLQSATSLPALRTAPRAAFWRVMLLEFKANLKGYGDVMALGDGSSAQNSLDLVPHHLIVDRVLIRGDRLDGQKRGIGLNSASTTIVNSYIGDIKAVGQDSQAIAGWNGPGPYRIENNYLEGAGEVFLLGGDDPKIPGLTPSDLTLTGNTLTRPLAWMNPIVAAPTDVRPTIATGGALAAGTYGYRVVARRPVSNQVAKSPASTEVLVTVGAGTRVDLTWTAVPDATEYVVYGRTPAAENMYWIVRTPSFSDTGAAGTAGTPSSTGTSWQIKNLLEFKNTQRGLISENLLENNWLQAQQGIAVLFSPRNQYGACTWCVVQQLTFERNVVRHVSGAIKILGRDDLYPSQQTNNIVIRNNEFSDLNKAAFGGDGYFLTLIDGPRDVTLDHNTIVSPSGRGVIAIAGAAVYNFTFSNNVARHNNYGIQGDSMGVGNTAIAYYLPGSVISRNVFAGGKASSYPAGNEFPTTTDFEAHFAAYPYDDFSLKAGTNWERTGTDGLDLGADYRALWSVHAYSDVAPPTVTTTSLPPAREREGYAMTLGASGGTPPYNWRLVAGALPGGLLLDSIAGAITGAPLTHGDYSFAVELADATGATTTQPLGMRVDQAVPPVQLMTLDTTPATMTVPYASALVAAGGSGAYRWTISNGALPAGVTMSADGVVAGTPQAMGTFAFGVTVFDAADPSRFDSRPFSLAVMPPPNQAPTVALSTPANGAVLPVGSTVTLNAAAADSDGTIVRVDFYLAGVPIGSAVAAPFTMPWTVPASGSFTFTAMATDNLGATAVAPAVTVTTKSEVVMNASHVSRMVGNYQLLADTLGSQGRAIWNPNKGVAKVATALASPASFVELTFVAQAGRPYHLWIRGRAERNDYANDSVFVQFDNVATARIGTTASLTVNLEDGAGAGVAGYGWQDDGYGIGVLGGTVVFDRTGVQTIRIQPREDGFVVDEIVLSPERYLTTAPGALKNDTTILVP